MKNVCVVSIFSVIRGNVGYSIKAPNFWRLHKNDCQIMIFESQQKLVLFKSVKEVIKRLKHSVEATIKNSSLIVSVSEKCLCG